MAGSIDSSRTATCPIFGLEDVELVRMRETVEPVGNVKGPFRGAFYLRSTRTSAVQSAGSP